MDERFEELDKPECQLVGADGNIFNLVGLVSRCLKEQRDNRSLRQEQAKEMQQRVFNSGSYDEALRILMDYVEVC